MEIEKPKEIMKTSTKATLFSEMLYNHKVKSSNITALSMEQQKENLWDSSLYYLESIITSQNSDNFGEFLKLLVRLVDIICCCHIFGMIKLDL